MRGVLVLTTAELFRIARHAGNADAKGNRYSSKPRPSRKLTSFPHSQFGRNYALAVISNEPPVVPPRIVSKVAIYVPPKELVDAYLEEISRGYGLAWRAPVSLNEAKADAVDDEDVEGPEGGVGVKVR